MSAGRFAANWARRGRSSTEADLISRLRALPVPTPDVQFKTDLRAQLVVITSRIISESATAPSTARAGARVETAGDRGSRAASGTLRALRRPALALAGASTVLVLLLGMAVWMSGGALPGQSLYGVKRASENVQLSLAGNDTDKGRAYLEFAANRAKEAADLLSKPSAMLATGGVTADSRRVSPRTASLVTDTLASADAQSKSGMQLLGRAAVAQLSKEPLADVSKWLPDQRAELTEVRDRIPAGALHNRAQASLTLLQRIAARTAQLTSKMGCPCLAQALSDELGPLPCDACASVRNPAPHGGSGSTGGSGSVPIPGLLPPGGSAASSSLPSLSLPALGGSSGRSSSGQVVGPVGSVSGPALPPTVPVSQPAPGMPPTGPGTISAGPVTVGSSGVTVSLPNLGPGPVTGTGIGTGSRIGTGSVIGSPLPSLPLPLPSVRFP